MFRRSRRSTRALLAALLLVAAVPFATGSASAATEYRATLSANEVVLGPGDETLSATASLLLLPDDGRACAFIDFSDHIAPTGVRIGQGAPGEDLGDVLFFDVTGDPDEHYSNCVDADPALLTAIISNVSDYFLEVGTDGFPDGAIRGAIESFDTGITVNFAKLACPGKVRSLVDIDPNTFAPCVVAARTGDIDPAPDGYRYDPRPILFDLQAELTDDNGTLTLDAASSEGGGTCNSETRVCSAGRSYAWSNILGEDVTVREVTLPRGYSFGDALVFADGVPVTGTVDMEARTVTLSTAGVQNDLSIIVFDFRGPSK